MTLYKALSIALWMDFDKVFVLGMDNTYPHDVFVDEDNRLWQVLVHGFGESTRVDRTAEYGRIANYLFEQTQLFADLYQFPSERVVNLDFLSLTDAFPKIPKNIALKDVLANNSGAVSQC